MNFSSMDTRFLQSFVNVVENGSIAEAARRLNLTSATIAHQIRALEREIGAQLLARSGRTVRPTEAGAKIMAWSRNLLREVQNVAALVVDDKVSGELRLGSMVTALIGSLPGILALVADKYPQLAVHVVPGESRDLCQRVQDGDLDAAIVIQPEFIIPKTCGWRILREESLILLARASMSTRNPHTVLKTEPFIRYSGTASGGRLADNYLRQTGIQPQQRFEINSLTSIPFLVDRGLGVSLVPDWALSWPRGMSLAKLALPGQSGTRRVGLLWMRASIRIRLVHAFLEAAVASLCPKTPDHKGSR
jgi:DNA-binding transcriptional LysR family regulator